MINERDFKDLDGKKVYRILEQNLTKQVTVLKRQILILLTFVGTKGIDTN